MTADFHHSASDVAVIPALPVAWETRNRGLISSVQVFSVDANAKIHCTTHLHLGRDVKQFDTLLELLGRHKV